MYFRSEDIIAGITLGFHEFISICRWFPLPGQTRHRQNNGGESPPRVLRQDSAGPRPERGVLEAVLQGRGVRVMKAGATADPGPAYRARTPLFYIIFGFVFVKFDCITRILFNCTICILSSYLTTRTYRVRVKGHQNNSQTSTAPPGFENPGSVLRGRGQGQQWHNQKNNFALVRFFVLHSRGFFNCLSKDGKVYDEIKHVWLQARQVGVSGSEGIGFFLIS